MSSRRGSLSGTKGGQVTRPAGTSTSGSSAWTARTKPSTPASSTSTRPKTGNASTPSLSSPYATPTRRLGSSSDTRSLASRAYPSTLPHQTPAETERGVFHGRGMAAQTDVAHGSSLVMALTRAVVLSVVVAAMIMLGLPAVLALGAGHP